MSNEFPSDGLCNYFVMLLDEECQEGITPEMARDLILSCDVIDDEAHKALFQPAKYGLTFAQVANAIMRLYWFDKMDAMFILQPRDPGLMELNSLMMMVYRNGYVAGRDAGYMAASVNNVFAAPKKKDEPNEH